MALKTRQLTRQPTRVINIKSGDLYDVYVGRAGKGMSGDFGNPFVVGGGFRRGEAVKAYGEWFPKELQTNEAFKFRLEQIVGRARTHNNPVVLACFCAPIPGFLTAKGPLVCHGQIIAAYLDQRLSE